MRTGRWCGLVAVALLAWGLATMTAVAEAAPMISVSPSTGLLDGQTVTVSGTGFRPLATVYVATCPPTATQPLDCDESNFASLGADVDGSVTITYTVHRLIRPSSDPGGAPLDCAHVACRIGATDDPFAAALGTDPLVPVTFASPQLQVTVEPVSTIDATTNEVVTRARVICDLATSISLVATFRQNGIERPFAILQEHCDPSRPTELFLTGYEPEFGPAFLAAPMTVTITVAPFAPFTPEPTTPDAVTITADSDPWDAGALRDAIVTLLADPANVALRQEMADAIAARARQDPIFAAAFAAALAAAAVGAGSG
jgi:hypothetical protein